jgi:hypothetical protein
MMIHVLLAVASGYEIVPIDKSESIGDLEKEHQGLAFGWFHEKRHAQIALNALKELEKHDIPVEVAG